MKQLPKQVQQQINQAEATLAAMNAPAQPAPVEEAAPAVDAAPAPVEQPSAPAAPAPTAPADSAPPAPAPVKDDAAVWEQRYRTLQGMHNQNTADLKQRLTASERDRQALEQRLTELERRMAAPPAPAAPAVDPQDAETFGADLVDMVRRIAGQTLSAQVAAFEARVAAVEQNLTGTSKAVSQTAEEVFLGQLATRVPDYEAVNADPDFLVWLGEVDPVYGAPRQAALDNAAAALDAVRVARIFTAFKATKGAPAPAPAAPTKSARELERHVAPEAGVAAAATTQPARAQVSQADVTRFYNDVARGRYRGREAEAARIEAQINQALADGRVV